MGMLTACLMALLLSKILTPKGCWRPAVSEVKLNIQLTQNQHKCTLSMFFAFSFHYIFCRNQGNQTTNDQGSLHSYIRLSSQRPLHRILCERNGEATCLNPGERCLFYPLFTTVSLFVLAADLSGC